LQITDSCSKQRRRKGKMDRRFEHGYNTDWCIGRKNAVFKFKVL